MTCTCDTTIIRPNNNTAVIATKEHKIQWFGDKSCPEHGYEILEINPIYPVRKTIWLRIEQVGLIAKMFDAKTGPKLLGRSPDGKSAQIEFTCAYRRDPPPEGQDFHISD